MVARCLVWAREVVQGVVTTVFTLAVLLLAGIVDGIPPLVASFAWVAGVVTANLLVGLCVGLASTLMVAAVIAWWGCDFMGLFRPPVASLPVVRIPVRGRIRGGVRTRPDRGGWRTPQPEASPKKRKDRGSAPHSAPRGSGLTGPKRGRGQHMLQAAHVVLAASEGVAAQRRCAGPGWAFVNKSNDCFLSVLVAALFVMRPVRGAISDLRGVPGCSEMNRYLVAMAGAKPPVAQRYFDQFRGYLGDLHASMRPRDMGHCVVDTLGCILKDNDCLDTILGVPVTRTAVCRQEVITPNKILRQGSV